MDSKEEKFYIASYHINKYELTEGNIVLYDQQPWILQITIFVSIMASVENVSC